MKTLTVTMMVKNLISLTFILGYVAGREPEVEIQDLFGDVLFQQGIFSHTLHIGSYIYFQILRYSV